MDIGKLQQAIEGIRRHLAAGDKEAAIAHFSESMGIDRKVAEQAIEQMASNQPAAVSRLPSSMRRRLAARSGRFCRPSPAAPWPARS
jgi:hypothetical protein